MSTSWGLSLRLQLRLPSFLRSSVAVLLFGTRRSSAPHRTAHAHPPTHPLTHSPRGGAVRHSQVQRTAQYKLAWQAVVTVAQRKIKAGDGGIIYAMTDRMSARLRWGGVL